MAMTNDATPKPGGGGELEKRVTAVEARLGVIEKTMVTSEVFEREIGALRDEMHVGLDGLRHEMQQGLGGLRHEIHEGLGKQRQEIQTELGTARGEIAGLRGDMNAELGNVRVEIAGLRGEMRAEIAKIPFELVKWLIALAGIAAAIATSVYNIWFR